MLATDCLPRFLHPSGLLGFCSTSPGRHHRECSRCLGGRRLGSLPLVLEERRLQPRRVGVAEAHLRQLRCLLGVSTTGKAGCWLAAWRHCLGVFPECRSRHWQAPEFWVRRCERKSPLVVQLRWALPPRPCASPPVRWCVTQGLEYYPGWWMIFWPTKHNMSHRYYLQYLPLMWRHCLGWRAYWVTRFEGLLVV